MIELPRGGDGKRHRKLRRATTKTEAQRKLKEIRDELNTTGKVASQRRSIADAVAQYRSGRPESDHDDWLFGLVLDGLGNRRIAKLSVEECDDFLRSAANGLGGRRPIGKAQMTRVRQGLISTLTNEQRLGYVIRNVGALAELPEPGASTKERAALSVEELNRLAAVAEGWQLAMIELGGRNGLRPAEARALRWTDLDLDEGLLSVTGQNNRANQRSNVKRANNAARTIQMDPRTIDVLLRRQADQADAKRSELVVATGKALAGSAHGGAGNASALPTGRRNAHHPYELRHTAITHQADAGWSSFEIADWAGTSEQMISDRYRHRLRRISRLQPGRPAGRGY